jgi:hypothetical protein
MANAAASSDPFRIDLAGWLGDFDPHDRKKGRRYYDEGRFIALEISHEGPEPVASAVVRGEEDYECTLTHLPGEGWDGECTCPVGYKCKHLYATGTALLHQLLSNRAIALDQPAPPPPAPGRPPDEESLVAQFTQATGAAPARKQLSYLRNLLDLFRSVRAGGPYFHFQALQNLLPASHRHGVFSYYQNPFKDRWSHPPTVEQKIRALQKEKAALAAAVVQEESLASVLDLESLRRILA